MRTLLPSMHQAPMTSWRRKALREVCFGKWNLKAQALGLLRTINKCQLMALEKGSAWGRSSCWDLGS